MSRIRKLYYFDKKNAREMVAFLNNGETYVNRIMFNPISPLHHILPLRLKFLPESYVLKDGKVMKGLITVAPSKYPLKQMEIQKLLFEENCYEDASELVQFVVSKYKAMGVASIIVRIDDYLPELVKLFISKCGFSQISYEKLWKLPEKNLKKTEKGSFNPKMYRVFRNSDAQAVANLYNESLLPHFRPLLSKDTKEFREPVFSGLSYYSEYRYVLEDTKTKNIIGYLSIQTQDNENYIVDIIQTPWAELDIDELVSFVNYQISKRKKRFNIFLKTKKYAQIGEKQEQEFLEKKFECVQNQIVLTNSSAKIIRNAEHAGKFTVLNQLYGAGVGVNLS